MVMAVVMAMMMMAVMAMPVTTFRHASHLQCGLYTWGKVPPQLTYARDIGSET